MLPFFLVRPGALFPAKAQSFPPLLKHAWTNMTKQMCFHYPSKHMNLATANNKINCCNCFFYYLKLPTGVTIFFRTVGRAMLAVGCGTTQTLTMHGSLSQASPPYGNRTISDHIDETRTR